MYNLLVSADENAWEGEPIVFEERRCIYEYTDNALFKKYHSFSGESIEALTKFPCVFAYEAFNKKDPKFGLITEIKKRQGEIKIHYEIVHLNRFMTHEQFKLLEFELDILEWEMNRTHWALKNVNLPKELAAVGIYLPRWSRNKDNIIDITKHIFDVALSFPGEIRSIVEPIVAELESKLGPNSYFYDNNYTAQLARPSLDLVLQDIYRNRSKLVVVFLCAYYQEKEWCGVEFRAIKDIIKSKQHDRIMFIRTDNSDIEGVFNTDGYIDATRFGSAEIAGFIYERVSLVEKRLSN